MSPAPTPLLLLRFERGALYAIQVSDRDLTPDIADELEDFGFVRLHDETAQNQGATLFGTRRPEVALTVATQDRWDAAPLFEVVPLLKEES